MSAWLNGLSQEEKREIQEDACVAYQTGVIPLTEFSGILAGIGMNATDIAELEKFYRPSPPENEDA